MRATYRTVGEYVWTRPWLSVAAVTALGLILRLIRIDFQPLWFDEGYSFYFAGSSVSTLIAATAVDIHPPLYYLLLKGWMALLGVGPIQARLLSVAIGTITIPLLFALGRQVAGSRVGLAAAALLAVSPFHIYYSQEVRMYGLITLLAVLAGFLTLRAFERVNHWPGWVASALAIAGSLYTQYYAAFIPAALTVYLLFRRDRVRRCLWRWMLTLAGAGLAYLPWLLYAWPRLTVYVQYKVGMDQDAPLSLMEFLRRVAVALGAGHLEDWLAGHWWLGLITPALVLIGLIALTCLRRSRRVQSGLQERHPLVLGIASLALPVLGGYIINLVAPFNPPRSERLLLMTLPAFCLLAAYLLVQLLRSRLRLKWPFALLCMLIYLATAGVSLAAFYAVPRYPEGDYRPIAAEIAARGRPEDAIICVMPWQMGFFQAYLQEPRPALLQTPGEIFPKARQLWADDPELMAHDLTELTDAHSRLWAPAYLASGSPLEGDIIAYLDGSSVRALSLWHGTTLLTLHVPAPRMAFGLARADFGGLVALTDTALNVDPIESAYGAVVFSASWEKASPFDQDYRMVFRLADDRERTWGQWDVGPAHGQHPFSEWAVGESHIERVGLLVDAGTPPGSYVLKLSLRGDDDIPLAAKRSTGAEPDVEVVIGSIEVVRPATPINVDQINPESPLRAELDHQLLLLGHDLGRRRFAPGEELRLTLYWNCQQPIAEELVTFTQLFDSDGTLVAAAEVPPTAGFFPTSRWQAGDVIRDRQTLRLPAALLDGDYELIVGLFKQSDQQRLTITAGRDRGEDHVALGSISIEDRSHDYKPPAPAYRVEDVQFGELCRLVGYATGTQADEDGEERLLITLYWGALQETPVSYKVFVHAYDGEGRRIAQHDSEPGQGAFPTAGWLTGEYIVDAHPLRIDDTRPASIQIGLYDPDSGQRLSLVDPRGAPIADHVTLTPAWP